MAYQLDKLGTGYSPESEYRPESELTCCGLYLIGFILSTTAP